MKSTSHQSLSLFAALCFALGLMASIASAQQDSSSFFHQGARHFLATNELTQAKLAVTNGLQMFPTDEKLKKLWELLNQQQQDKDDKNQQQDKKDQSSDDQKSKDQQKQDKEKQEQQKKEQEKQQQDQGSKQDKQQDEEKKGQQGEKGEEQKEGDGAPQSAKAMRMTPQQAMQLLEALKGDEKAMPFRPILKTNRQDRIFKDW